MKETYVSKIQVKIYMYSEREKKKTGKEEKKKYRKDKTKQMEREGGR